MTTKIDTLEREAVLVEEAHVRPMMGIEVLEPVPSAQFPYSTLDPFVLVHEATVPITDEWAARDTAHPHRGFDNIWYLLSGSASTGHTTGPAGATERARLRAGSVLKLRTGRGVWHAEGIGQDEVREGVVGAEMHSLLFWVNLARRDKDVAPSSQLLEPDEVPIRHEGDATVRVLVGEGSPIELGTPGLILDVQMRAGGEFRTSIPAEFNACVYVIDGEARIGANGQSAKRHDIAVLGSGDGLIVRDAQPGTRFMVMAGKPYGEEPIFNGPYVD